ncbi:hypothetical protein D9M73_114400 [compost metagenome]
MTDLSHWGAAESFTAQEAAALIVGLDPADPEAKSFKAKPVLDRMAEGHRVARSFVGQAMTPEQFAFQRKQPAWRDALVSLLFDNYPTLQKASWPSDAGRPFELPQRFRGDDGNFAVQRFDRAELARWLSVVGIKSVYDFSATQPQAAVVGIGNREVVEKLTEARWPWGSHHTKALEHLEAAARRFWVNYDPSDVTTASTNKEISQWLEQERGVSRNLAASIASMLRPDGLPTRPR